MGYTLWLNIHIAIENGPFIVDLPIKKMVDLSIAMLNYQRVWDLNGSEVPRQGHQNI